MKWTIKYDHGLGENDIGSFKNYENFSMFFETFRSGILNLNGTDIIENIDETFKLNGGYVVFKNDRVIIIQCLLEYTILFN